MNLAWVREVCPLVRLRPMPGAPEWLRGLMDHHGVLVPVLDLGVMLGGTGIEPAVGARILLLEGPLGSTSDARHALFGALVDAVDAPVTLDRDGSWSVPDGLPGLPFLHEVARAGPGLVLVLDAGRLAGQHPALLQGAGSTPSLPDDPR